MDLSVVVCCYNSEKIVGDCLKALNNQSYPKEKYEVIVIDDGSTDGTSKIAREAGTRVIKNKVNMGLGYSRKLGINIARGDVIAFTDDDCIPDRDWIKELLAGYKKGIDGVGGMILPYSLDSIWEIYAYYSRTPLYSHSPYLGGRRIFEYLKRFLGFRLKAENSQRMESLMGANSSFRRSTLQSVEGTSKDLRRGVDWDLNLRLKEKDARLVYLEKPKVRHRHRQGATSFLRHISAYGEAYARLSRKHGGLPIPYPTPLVLLLLAAAGYFSLVPLYAFAAFLFLREVPNCAAVFGKVGKLRIFALFPAIEVLRETVYDYGILKGLLKG
ncbi:MAG: glycosyltransferase [archaeon]